MGLHLESHRLECQPGESPWVGCPARVKRECMHACMRVWFFLFCGIHIPCGQCQLQRYQRRARGCTSSDLACVRVTVTMPRLSGLVGESGCLSLFAASVLFSAGVGLVLQAHSSLCEACADAACTLGEESAGHALRWARIAW